MQTDRQTDRETDRQTDRQPDRQTHALELSGAGLGGVAAHDHGDGRLEVLQQGEGQDRNHGETPSQRSNVGEETLGGGGGGGGGVRVCEGRTCMNNDTYDALMNYSSDFV